MITTDIFINPSLSLLAIVNLLGAAQGVLLTLALLGARDDNKTANRLLAGLTLTISIVVSGTVLLTSYWLLQKSTQQYSADPVVKFGFCRGIEPVNYVTLILERFDHYKQFVVARLGETTLQPTLPSRLPNFVAILRERNVKLWDFGKEIYETNKKPTST